MSRVRTLFLLVAASSVIAACQQPAREPASESTPSWTLSLPGGDAFPGPNTAQPQLTSSAAGVVLSWIDESSGTSVLKFAEHTKSGWSPPRTVASGSDWFVNDADVPAVLRTSGGTLVATWYQETDARLEAMNLWMALSRDNGITWDKPVTPHRDRTKTQHGFASMFEQPGGRIGVVWLDGRQFELEPEAPGGGAMAMRVASVDTTGRSSADDLVAPKVCECCQTGVTLTADGPLVAYRGRTDQEIRDVFVTRLEGAGWSAPVTVHPDNWEIYACPVSGPAVSARERTVAAAWFTAAGGQERSLLAFSSDAGRTWGAPIQINDGDAASRVDVELLADGSAVATWVESTDGREQFKLRRVDSSGVLSPAITVAGTGAGRLRGYPRLALHDDTIVLAWAERQGDANVSEPTSRVLAVVAPLPGR